MWLIRKLSRMKHHNNVFMMTILEIFILKYFHMCYNSNKLVDKNIYTLRILIKMKYTITTPSYTNFLYLGLLYVFQNSC